jgi:hypothetical protein
LISYKCGFVRRDSGDSDAVFVAVEPERCDRERDDLAEVFVCSGIAEA